MAKAWEPEVYEKNKKVFGMARQVSALVFLYGMA